MSPCRVAGTGCNDRPGASVPIHSPAPFRQGRMPFDLPRRNREGSYLGRSAKASDGVAHPPEPHRRSRPRGKRPDRVARLASSQVTGLLALALMALSGNAGLAGQLPPEAQADRYLLQAEDWIRQQDFVAAKGALDRIVELQEEASSREQPVTRVRISRSFELGKHEVTEAEWEYAGGDRRGSLRRGPRRDCVVRRGL